MKKVLAVFIIICIAFISCNQDSIMGVLQHAHSASQKENSYNEAYLGYQKTDGEPILFLLRDGDVYAVQSVGNNNGTFDLKYDKVIELSTRGFNCIPIAYLNGYIYFARKSGDSDESAVFKFYKKNVWDTSNGLVLDDLAPGEKEVTTGTDGIVRFSVSHIDSENIQIIFKKSSDESSFKYISIPRETLSTEGINAIDLPSNAVIIGNGAFRVTTDDPLMDYPDELNDVYFINSEGELKKIYTSLSYYYFGMGFDEEYVAYMNGYVYKIKEDSSHSGYDYTLDNTVFSFDTYRRSTNFLITYRDGEDTVVGYIYDSGVYYRSGNSAPVLKAIYDDADIMPLCFVGKIDSSKATTYGTKNETQYLLLTQDNGFYVVDPFGISDSRASSYKIENSGGAVPLSAFFSTEESS